jgi:lysylphosphatidylglycerol synthetase-like protein (DUF2156 family)
MSCHVVTGTLKLLYEDIISKLRAEGRRELAFGFAPFFNVRDDVFSRLVYWIRWTNLYFYHCANNLYAFQNLAFSKIRCASRCQGVLLVNNGHCASVLGSISRCRQHT